MIFSFNNDKKIIKGRRSPVLDCLTYQNPIFCPPISGPFLFYLPFHIRVILYCLLSHIRAILLFALISGPIHFIPVVLSGSLSWGSICPLNFIPSLSGSSTPRIFWGNLFYPPFWGRLCGEQIREYILWALINVALLFGRSTFYPNFCFEVIFDSSTSSVFSKKNSQLCMF